MEIFNLADEVKNCGFAVFTNALQAGGGVHGICAKGAFKALYKIFIGKTAGPRLGSFLASMDQKFVVNRLIQASN